MADFGPSAILLAVLLMLLMGVVAAIFMAWGWLIWRMMTGQPILPESPLVKRGEPPWRLGTILVVVLAYIAVSLLASFGYYLLAGTTVARAHAPARVGSEVKAGQHDERVEPLDRAEVRKDGKQSGMQGEKHGSSPPAPPQAAAKVAGGPQGPHPAQQMDVEKKVSWTHMMLLNSLVDIALLMLTPYVVSKTSGARLRDFGLSFEGWERQAACGLVATLIAAPLVYAIQFGVVRIWEPKAHPLMTMMFEEFSVGVGALAIVTAVILAPMFEELAFRGLLQSWLVGALDRGAGPASMASLLEIESPFSAESAPPAEFWDAEPEGPSHSQVATIPPPTLTKSTGRGWLAIVLTSILFAYVHSPQWPAPIPLFALALVIGTVYYRTGSLIAAIFMHATFNGISTLMLLIAVLTGRNFGADKMPINVTVEIRERFDGKEGVCATRSNACVAAKSDFCLFFL